MYCVCVPERIVCVWLWCQVGTDCAVVAMCMLVVGVGNEGVLVYMYSVTGLFVHVYCGIVCQFIKVLCINVLMSINCIWLLFCFHGPLIHLHVGVDILGVVCVS